MTPRTNRACFLCLALTSATLIAGNLAAAEVPAPWRDDADLHAVHFVGKTIGWAVGDRGVALRTIDGGRTWEPRHIGDDEISLRAVCFLTDSVGWVAGGTTVPYTQSEPGAVYATEDAGATWRRVNTAPLPRIHAMRFFSRDEGIAAGAASPSFPSGVLRTSDGGATWEAVDTGTVSNPSGWRAAAFPTPDRGAIVGQRMQRAVITGSGLLPSRGEASGLRGLNAVAFSSKNEGWAVGDGGLLVQTRDGGLVWQDPVATLPSDVRSFVDLHSVAAVGNSIWTAGRPGGVIWHSSDKGQSWRAQPIGSSLPILGLHFATETDGVAVGAMGLIVRTIDGGANWTPVRAADRRAALLSISLAPKQIDFPLVATCAGDQGYRSVILLPVRHDIGPADRGESNLDVRTHDAVVSAGGNAAITDWPLPLAVPGLEAEQDALVAEWNRSTEGKLEQILVGRLVAAIRTWRPEVVVLDEPSAGNAAGLLLFEASKIAINQAGDPTRYVELRPALLPWNVKKAYVRLRNAEPADAAIDRSSLLPRLGRSTADVAETAAARVDATDASLGERATYRLLPLDPNAAPAAGPFFAGLAIPTDSASRRAVTDATADPRAVLNAKREKILRGYVARAFDDPRQSGGIIAQIEQISAGVPDAQAARQLFMLAEAQRARSQWELAEQTYVALVERYPNEPPSREAMVWLLRLWTGAEPIWCRMKDEGSTAERTVPSAGSLADRLDKAVQMAQAGESAATPEEIAKAGLAAEPLTTVTQAGAIKIGAASRWDEAKVAHWKSRALRLADLIRQTDPSLFLSPEVQLPLALLARSGGGSAAARLQQSALMNGLAASAAASTLTTKSDARTSAAKCGLAPEPPHLDGSLSDPVWRNAEELRFDSEASMPDGSIAFVARDEEFLYLAASIPRVPARPMPSIELAGRTHDADLSRHDRLVFLIDIDRDTATWYRFAVDARGHTAEECWGDATWNPKWYVAADGDEDRWRIEAAIPLSELTSRIPAPGELWSISFARIAPAVGVQGWPLASDGEPRPESFGLMRFE